MNFKILISFCNTSSYPETKKNEISPLAVLNPNKNIISWIKLPEKISCTGITGLTQNDKCIFALYQAKTPGLIIFNKKGFFIKKYFELPKIKDPHSILWDNDSLYIVSTGTDRILKYKAKVKGNDINISSPTTIWKPTRSNGKKDTHHLNSICKCEKRLLVSAFGKKRGKKWSTARKGYILDIKTNKKIISPIYHPHSACCYQKNILFCESSSQSLKKTIAI